MKKRRDFFITASIIPILGIMILGGFSYSDYRKRVFKSPTNLAQKVANYVVKNSKSIDVGYGLDDSKHLVNGKQHKYKVTAGHTAYVIEVGLISNGEKNISIDYYNTNRDFDELKTAEDFIIEELQMGQPGIHTEKHFFDKKIDGNLECWQMFAKPTGNYVTLYDFTREERDKGEKAGVHKYCIHGGRVVKEGKWVDETEDRKKGAQEDYEVTLEHIAKELKIQDSNEKYNKKNNKWFIDILEEMKDQKPEE